MPKNVNWYKQKILSTINANCFLHCDLVLRHVLITFGKYFAEWSPGSGAIPFAISELKTTLALGHLNTVDDLAHYLRFVAAHLGLRTAHASSLLADLARCVHHLYASWPATHNRNTLISYFITQISMLCWCRDSKNRNILKRH